MKNLHVIKAKAWDTIRSCNSKDIILVSCGIQCTNCGARSEDHGKTWISAYNKTPDKTQLKESEE